MKEALTKVRIDKWLWAARFFKTRSLAKQAIDGGKIHIAGHKVKASKDITVGLLVMVRQGWDEKEVLVTALSNQRRGASEAALLYEETTASQERREDEAVQRKLIRGTQPVTEGRPNKKQRRQIHRFINVNSE